MIHARTSNNLFGAWNVTEEEVYYDDQNYGASPVLSQPADDHHERHRDAESTNISEPEVQSDMYNTSLLQSAQTTQTLVYNRVQKCGSNTMTAYLRMLSERNGFNITRSVKHHQRRLDVNEQVQSE